MNDNVFRVARHRMRLVRADQVLTSMTEADARALLRSALDEAGGDAVRAFGPMDEGCTAGDVIGAVARGVGNGELVVIKVPNPPRTGRP